MNLKYKIKNLPHTSGIYLFYDTKKELVYVGKATDLKSRVGSYFKGQKTNRPIEQMIHEIKDIKHKQTDSVLEAILLEGVYIKKYQPKYNIDWKDDKSWNYIIITDDVYPKVVTIRQHELDNIINDADFKQFKYTFGPYPGVKTKEMMQILQKLFYISTCSVPESGHKVKPCFYYQLGQCLGVCTGEITSAQYKKKVIAPLVKFLKGNKKSLLKDLERKMKIASQKEKFEEAVRLRNQISNLQKIQDIALLNKSFFNKSKVVDNRRLVIEGYDISNLGSDDKVGSMVVFESGMPSKGKYRKFNIKTVVGQSDVDCMAEVLRRRLKHEEWSLPDVFLIDGGKPQVGVALKILKEYNLDVPVVGIAKGPKRNKNEFIIKGLAQKSVQENKNLFIQVRDEAHRFAIKFNRSKRKIK